MSNRLLWIPGLLITLIAHADSPPDIGFANLRMQAVQSECFGPGSIHFDPALAEARDEFRVIADHPAGGQRLVLVGRLDRNSAQRYRIEYDDGPSCDPEFSIWLEGAAEPVGYISGEHLVLPGNGYLYMIRRSNRSFEGREKWEIKGGELVEVAQPLRYVGISTRTLKAIALRQTEAPGSTIIANVPAGETVSVVVQRSDTEGRDQYLVRSRFGLVGWVDDGGYGDDRQFEGLLYQGD